jgi:hypothetical protein
MKNNIHIKIYQQYQPGCSSNPSIKTKIKKMKPTVEKQKVEPRFLKHDR